MPKLCPIALRFRKRGLVASVARNDWPSARDCAFRSSGTVVSLSVFSPAQAAELGETVSAFTPLLNTEAIRPALFWSTMTRFPPSFARVAESDSLRDRVDDLGG